VELLLLDENGKESSISEHFNRAIELRDVDQGEDDAVEGSQAEIFAAESLRFLEDANSSCAAASLQKVGTTRSGRTNHN
jgi:hypothetical protein